MEMGAISKKKIHSEILAAVGSKVESYGSIDEVPFEMDLIGFGTFAFYAFTLTSPPGGRPTGEYKIQLIAPGQRRGTRGQFDFPSGAFTILIGWSQEERVFAMWDAYSHESFSYSRNLQVKGESVWLAQANGLSTSERHLRDGKGVETIVVCRDDFLLSGIDDRVRLSAKRLSNTGDDL